MITTADHGAPRCRRCGQPSDVLVAEPALWLCHPCSDDLGRDAMNSAGTSQTDLPGPNLTRSPPPRPFGMFPLRPTPWRADGPRSDPQEQVALGDFAGVPCPHRFANSVDSALGVEAGDELAAAAPVSRRYHGGT